MQSVNETNGISSIIDLMNKAEKVINPLGKGGTKDTYLGGSISNYTKNLIMTFPCMCDDSLSPSTASMISRANERNIVTMLHILFSSMNMTTSKNAVDVIKSIHNNIKTNYNIDDYMDTMQDLMDESVKLDPVQEKAIVANMLKTMREAKSFPINSLDESSSLLDYEVRGKDYDLSIRESKKGPTRRATSSSQTTTQDSNGSHKTSTTDNYGNYNDYDPITGTTKSNDPDDNPNGRTPDDLDYQKKVLDTKYAKNRETRERERFNNEEKDRVAKNLKDKNEFFTKRLLDADVKKANEMQPALMIINYNQINPNDPKVVVGKESFVAGVKSRLISVEAQDIIDRIFAKNKTKVNFKNFIRATTGEISFVKDFLLCINQAKIDAKNSSKKGVAANMWKTLENRSIKNVWNKLRREGNDASAITVLVVSQETVNALNKYYNINLSNVRVAKDVMETYNLMGIVIADDSIEVAKFLYAGNDMWDQQAYSFLQKEAKDNSYKQVVNLLNKNMI